MHMYIITFNDGNAPQFEHAASPDALRTSMGQSHPGKSIHSIARM